MVSIRRLVVSGLSDSSNEAYERGLIMHNALAFTASGVPLGILSQRIWARQEVPEEGYQEKIERLQVTPIEEKESSKWLLALEETVARTPRGIKVVTVADRESDFFEFLAAAQEHRALFLIRARTDRLLVPEESAGHESLLEAVAHASLLGSLEVEIPGNGKRKARSASVAVRVAQVTIRPPQRRGAAKASGSIEPIAVNAIWAAEKTAPGGAEPISWVLLTNLPVADFEAASEKIGWYGKRFAIETWHKVLKSGCQVERCLLETRRAARPIPHALQHHRRASDARGIHCTPRSAAARHGSVLPGRDRGVARSCPPRPAAG